MSKLAEAIKAETRGQGPSCTVGKLLARLPDDLRTDLTDALVSDVSATAISRALNSLGHEMKASPLQRHRRGDCCCDRG